MRQRGQDTDKRTWATASVLALLVHLGAVLLVRALAIGSPAEAATEPPVVQVVFAPEPPAAAEEPQTYTELPEDREDEAPEEADLLSNVTSRARDEVPGGTDASPEATTEEDIPQVAMEQGEPVPPAPDPVPAEPAPGAGPPAASPPAPESTPDLTRLPTGQLFAQPSTGSREPNARLPGDVSLNTTAWAYAPWLRAFRQRFEKHWIVPFGYRAGLIDGYTTLRAVIAKSGELLDLSVVDEGGHTALRGASVTSFRSAAPYPPLPVDFPEPTLILEIKLSYPRYPR